MRPNSFNTSICAFGLAAVLVGCGGHTANSRIAPPEGNTTVKVTLPGTAAAFIAYKDGQGAWKPLTGSGGEASFDITDPQRRYTLVVGRQDGTSENPSYHVQVWNATVGELPVVDLTAVEESLAPPTAANITGTVANLAGNEQGVEITNGPGWAWADALNPNFTLATTTGGYDVAAICRDSNWGLTRVALKRGVPVNGDMSLGTWDMDAEAKPLVGVTVRTDGESGWTGYRTGSGTWAGWGVGAVTAGEYTGANLAPSQRAAGDILYMVAGSTDRDTGRYFQSLAGADPNGTNLQVPLGSGLDSVTLTTAGTPARAQVQWSGAQGATFYYFGLWQNRPTENVGWEVMTSAKALGSATSYTLPDLTGISGYSANWNITDLNAGAAYWWVRKYDSNNGWVFGGPEGWDPRLKAGDLIKVVFRYGSTAAVRDLPSRPFEAAEEKGFPLPLMRKALPPALQEALKAARARK